MKRIIAIILVLALSLCFTGCNGGGEEENSKTPDKNANTQSTTATDDEDSGSDTTEKEEEEITAENWGVPSWWSAYIGDSAAKVFYVNFPNYTGYTEGAAMIAEQLDGTVALISGQGARCPEINKVTELFPAYYDHLEFSLNAFYGIRSKNYEFSLDDSEPVTIGDYEMCRFEGSFEFDDDDGHYDFRFVAYATTLKSNGAYAYWVVYDNSEDQSNGKLISEHALNMAKTFREE